MKVAVVGTGIMGSRMATNLLAAGHTVWVHNRTRHRATGLIEAGAVWSEAPADAAQKADILITMLAHPEAVEAAALGDAGFLEGMDTGKLWIDCSTVKPSFSRRMAQEASACGIRFLDAPVLGSKGPAERAELTFVVGGEQSDLDRCRPLLEVMGTTVVHVGGHGTGSAMKMVINHLLGATMEAAAESLVLGESLGIPQETLFDVMLGGIVAPKFIALKKEKIVREDFEPEFPMRWLQKDLVMVSQTAYEHGVAMPVANAAKEVYQLAVRRGLGDLDFSAIYAFLREQSA